MSADCVPIHLLLAAKSEAERLRQELAVYKGDVDVAAELTRAGMPRSRAEQSDRFIAAVLALARIAPDGIAPRLGVARALYGADGESEVHGASVHASRTRDRLLAAGWAFDTVPGVGFRPRRADEAPYERPRPTGAMCADCGGDCHAEAARCRVCEKARRQARGPLVCRTCRTVAVWNRGKRCLGCYRADMEVQVAATRARLARLRVCPLCKGRKKETARRCRACTLPATAWGRPTRDRRAS